MLDRLPAYALVHVHWTLPLAAALSALFYPFRSRVDAYRLAFLLLVAVVSTTPWDSYLVRSGIWSYPPEAIVGYTLFDIPAEEYFFFVIQTYITSLLYLLLGKPVFQPAYLATGEDRLRGLKLKWIGRAGMALLAAAFVIAVVMVREGNQGTYLGLIIAWMSPFLLFLWSLSYTHILSLPITNTLVPILAPTLYLWLVDTLALHRGTWVISTHTKLNIYLWPHLEIEEATFFLVTNAVIVLGQVTIDHALAILTAFPSLFPAIPALPSPILGIRAILTSTDAYDTRRLSGMRDALARLRAKSRSFMLASAAFEGRLRADLLLLYSFCRVADDLIDDAPDAEAAAEALRSLHRFLELAYAPATSAGHNNGALEAYVRDTFPPAAHASLLLLPTNILPREPLAELLEGFATDLLFAPGGSAATGKGPIASEHDLTTYAHRVAGTVGELCVALVFHHCRPADAGADWAAARVALGHAADTMGGALQLVNVSRDVWVDARLEPAGRVYIPDAWLADAGTSAAEVLDVARRATVRNGPAPPEERGEKGAARDAQVRAAIQACRRRLIRGAEARYAASRAAVERLPTAWGARRGVRLAVEAYMEIGRVLARRLDAGGGGSEEARREWEGRGKATVAGWRRAWTIWKALAV